MILPNGTIIKNIASITFGKTPVPPNVYLTIVSKKNNNTIIAQVIHYKKDKLAKCLPKKGFRVILSESFIKSYFTIVSKVESSILVSKVKTSIWDKCETKKIKKITIYNKTQKKSKSHPKPLKLLKGMFLFNKDNSSSFIVTATWHNHDDIIWLRNRNDYKNYRIILSSDGTLTMSSMRPEEMILKTTLKEFLDHYVVR